MNEKYYYKVDVDLNTGEEYKRILKTEKEVFLDEVKNGILKDVFFKIDDGDLESVRGIEMEEISKEVFDSIKKTGNAIELILDKNGYIKRPLVGVE